MKASEFIKNLAQEISKYGDVEIVKHDGFCAYSRFDEKSFGILETKNRNEPLVYQIIIDTKGEK